MTNTAAIPSTAMHISTLAPPAIHTHPSDRLRRFGPDGGDLGGTGDCVDGPPGTAVGNGLPQRRQKRAPALAVVNPHARQTTPKGVEGVREAGDA